MTLINVYVKDSVTGAPLQTVKVGLWAAPSPINRYTDANGLVSFLVNYVDTVAFTIEKAGYYSIPRTPDLKITGDVTFRYDLIPISQPTPPPTDGVTPTPEENPLQKYAPYIILLIIFILIVAYAASKKKKKRGRPRRDAD
jgi:hypothetical protein